jgi:hypothetical protein
LRCQLKTQVHPIRTDVQKKVTWRRYRAAGTSTEFTKGMQGCGTRVPKQAIPGIGTKAADARQVSGRDALAHGTNKRSDVGAPRAHCGSMIIAWRKRRDDKYRTARDWAVNGLRLVEVIRHWDQCYVFGSSDMPQFSDGASADLS